MKEKCTLFVKNTRHQALLIIASRLLRINCARRITWKKNSGILHIDCAPWTVRSNRNKRQKSINIQYSLIELIGFILVITRHAVRGLRQFPTTSEFWISEFMTIVKLHTYASKSDLWRSLPSVGCYMPTRNCPQFSFFSE